MPSLVLFFSVATFEVCVCFNMSGQEETTLTYVHHLTVYLMHLCPCVISSSEYSYVLFPSLPPTHVVDKEEPREVK